MFKDIKSTTINSIIYGLGNMSIKLIGFILLPFYTKHFSLQEYGVLGTTEVFAQLIVLLLGFSLGSAYVRWYYDKEIEGKQKSLLFTIMGFLFLSNLVFLAVLSGFSHKLSFFLLDSESYSSLLMLMFVSASLEILISPVFTLMRMQSRATLFSITNTIRFTINLVLTIFFIVKLEWGLEGIYIAQILGSIIFLLLNLKYLFQNIQFKIELNILKDIFKYSLPLIVASFFTIVINTSDRYIIKFTEGLDNVGLYSLGYKISNTLKVLFVNSIQLAITPFLFQIMNRENSGRLYSKIMTYLGLIIIISVLALSLFGKELIELVAQNKDYWDSYKVIPVLSFAVFFGMLKDTSMIGLQIHKKTTVIASITIIVAVINIALNIFLINLFGIMGAAISFMLSQFIYFIWVFKKSQAIYPIPYEMNKIVLMSLLTIIYIIIGLVLGPLPIVPRTVLKIILFASFPLSLGLFGFYEKKELKTLKLIWVRWRNPFNWLKNVREL